MKIQAFPPTVLQSRSFSEAWWKDLLAATEDESMDGRRREAVFAGCFAETALFEWARDAVFPWLRTEGLRLKQSAQHERGVEFKRRGELERLVPTLFPERSPLLWRWISVPAAAFALAGQEDLPGHYGASRSDFERLRELPEWIDLDSVIRLRNGFVHAHASRPKSTSIDPKYHPVPDQLELGRSVAGWACSVVEKVTRRLYADWGGEEPDWMRR